MEKKSSTRDFAGQTIYVGLDIGNKGWEVAVFTKDFEHKVFHQPPEPAKLVQYLRKHFPGAQYRAVYEAGYFGFWIHDELKALGVDCLVVHSPDVPTKDKEKRFRRDRVDARKLGRGLRVDELDPLSVPTRAAQEARWLVRTRWQLVKKETRCKNQIRAALKCYGIVIPEELTRAHGSRPFLNGLAEQQQESFLEPAGQQAFQALLDELDHLRPLLARVTRQIRALGREPRYRPPVENLLSIPGVGILTAMILLTELVDIDRFKSLDNVASYVGLVPGENSTGGEENQTGITYRRNAHLRRMLIEASWTAVRKDPALLRSFAHLAKRMPKNRAIVRIGRKLLNRIRYVLKHNEPYVTCVVE